ncbi:unnamed protein product, partial [Allacma fusca]
TQRLIINYFSNHFQFRLPQISPLTPF